MSENNIEVRNRLSHGISHSPIQVNTQQQNKQNSETQNSCSKTENKNESKDSESLIHRFLLWKLESKMPLTDGWMKARTHTDYTQIRHLSGWCQTLIVRYPGSLGVSGQCTKSCAQIAKPQRDHQKPQFQCKHMRVILQARDWSTNLPGGTGMRVTPAPQLYMEGI